MFSCLDWLKLCDQHHFLIYFVSRVYLFDIFKITFKTFIFIFHDMHNFSLFIAHIYLSFYHMANSYVSLLKNIFIWSDYFFFFFFTGFYEHKLLTIQMFYKLRQYFKVTNCQWDKLLKAKEFAKHFFVTINFPYAYKKKRNSSFKPNNKSKPNF